MKASAVQRTIIKDFSDQFAKLQEQYYVPQEDDEYWDSLTEDSMKLVSEFTTSDEKQNTLFSDMVMLFMKSREQML